MAKKLSKFGSAFDKARKSGASEFDFGGKKFNTKMKGESSSKKKSSKSKLPATTSVTPTARPSNEPAGKGYLSGPSKRGGGPKIAPSQANIDKRKARGVGPNDAAKVKKAIFGDGGFMKDKESLNNFRQKEARRAADEGSNKGVGKKIGKFMLGKGYKG